MVSLLVVDDETIIRRGLLTTLGKQEELMVVGAAESGTDALRMVEQLQPDLVITDINMPNMDGLQLLEQLRAIDEDLTFIVLTGYDHFSYAQRALRAGAADYLLKPCAPSQLIEVVKREAQKIERRKERQRHTDWLEQQLAVQKQREKGMDVSQQMMNLIHQKWNDPCLTMDLVAEALGMNPYYLRDVFRTVNRMSFVKYIRCVRLQKAKDLLQNSDLQIQMIAKSVGYTDSAYFASCFRDAFGVSPSEFREKKHE